MLECHQWLEETSPHVAGDARHVLELTYELRTRSRLRTQVYCDDALLLARAAYHLGNRHVALEVQRGQLRYLRDHVLAGMLTGLGLELEDIVAPFNPESGAYHGHTHASVATPAAPMLRLSGH